MCGHTRVRKATLFFLAALLPFGLQVADRLTVESDPSRDAVSIDEGAQPNVAERSETTGEPLTTDGNWPQWRGPLRDNRSQDSALLQEWPPEGPPLVWRVDGIGAGIASVSVAGGKVYTLGYYKGSE